MRVLPSGESVFHPEAAFADQPVSFEIAVSVHFPQAQNPSDRRSPLIMHRLKLPIGLHWTWENTASLQESPLLCTQSELYRLRNLE
jgi:hypothetical protein